MKNVDLKKLFKEEKTDSKPEHKKVLWFILFFFIFADFYAQIPVNSFCRLSTFQTQPGYSKIFSLNYNYDENPDLILYGAGSKSIVVHKGLDDYQLESPVTKFSYFPIDDLVALNGDNDENGFYVFISRKERLAGLISFTKYGTMQILNQIELDSYPGNIHAGDIDGDGKNEVVISGVNFNGLSILKEEKYILKETKISTGRIFSDAKMIDLDYDSFADIAAFDLFSNSIVFFYNQESELFREYRSINIGEEISELRITDFDNDHFEDLAYSCSRGIEIMLGDSVSTFDSKILYEPEVFTEKYQFADFNKDGLTDIAYIDKDDGNLFISFAKSVNEFYQPVHYLHDAGIEDLAWIDNTNTQYLAAMNISGAIYIISSFDKYEDNMSIAIGGMPGAVGCYNSLVDNMKDICFVDSYNNSLNLLINDDKKMCSKYYRFNLTDNHTNILVSKGRKAERTFFMFSYNQKIIEIVNLNFSNDAYTRNCIYTYSPIVDCKLNKDGKNLEVLIDKDSAISYINYTGDRYDYTSSEFPDIKKGVMDAAIINVDSLKFFYWFTDGDKIMNASLDINGALSDEKILQTLPGNQSGEADIMVKSFPHQYSNKEYAISILNDQANCKLVLFDGKKNIKIGCNQPVSVINKNHIFLCSSSTGMKNSLYIYDSGNELFSSVNIRSGQSDINLNKIFESISCNSYFIGDLKSGETFLVYSERFSNNIKLKRIE